MKNVGNTFAVWLNIIHVFVFCVWSERLLFLTEQKVYKRVSYIRYSLKTNDLARETFKVTILMFNKHIKVKAKYSDET